MEGRGRVVAFMKRWGKVLKVEVPAGVVEEGQAGEGKDGEEGKSA